MPPQFQEPFQNVSMEAKQVMSSLGKGPDAYGLIHADLYPENVLFKAGKAYPIDFEDCGYGYWIWDIAVALCQWAWNKDWERMRDAFREGYAQVRTLPEAQWSQLGSVRGHAVRHDGVMGVSFPQARSAAGG